MAVAIRSPVAGMSKSFVTTLVRDGGPLAGIDGMDTLAERVFFEFTAKNGRIRTIPNDKELSNMRRAVLYIARAVTFAAAIGITDFSVADMIILTTNGRLGQYKKNRMEVNNKHINPYVVSHELGHHIQRQFPGRLGMYDTDSYREAGAMLFGRLSLSPQKISSYTLEKIEEALIGMMSAIGDEDIFGTLSRIRRNSEWLTEMPGTFEVYDMLSRLLPQTKDDFAFQKYVRGAIMVATVLPFYGLNIGELAKDLLTVRQFEFTYSLAERIANSAYDREIALGVLHRS